MEVGEEEECVCVGGWCSRIKSVHDEGSIHVYVCICVAGGGWVAGDAVNLRVPDRKSVVDHFHKSDQH